MLVLIVIMPSVQCALCRESFSGKQSILNHYVNEHNVPKDDKILNRYVTLRFSSVEKRGKNLSILLKLLKVLKQRALSYTVEREKKQVEQDDIINLLKYYLNNNDDDDDDDEQLNRMIHVKWFLKFYNIYVNKVEKETIAR